MLGYRQAVEQKATTFLASLPGLGTENTAASGSPVGLVKPLLFLDVDGVLNAFGGDDPVLMIDGYGCNVNEGLADRVGRLLMAFEPVWCTAWRGTAHAGWRNILRLEGDPWPYVDYKDLKLPELLRYAKARPWAWVDDEIEFELRQLGWDTSMLNGLIIEPDMPVGLTDEHVDELLAWAANLD